MRHFSVFKKSVWLLPISPLSLAVFGCAVAWTTPSRAGATPVQPITLPEQIWTMPAEERDLSHPVDITVHVNYINQPWRVLWVEAGGIGSFIPLAASGGTIPVHAGQLVHMTGSMIPSKGLAADHIHVDVLA